MELKLENHAPEDDDGMAMVIMAVAETFTPHQTAESLQT
jgi:hypothetical protein